MDKLKNTRILSAIGLVSLYLGIFLPYFKFSFYTYKFEVRLWGYLEGKIMMSLIFANTLFIFKDYVEKYVPQLFNSDLGNKIKNANEKMAIVPTIGVVLFVITLFLRLDIDKTVLKHGLGFYTLWLGVICLVVHTFIYQKNGTNNQVSNNLQQSVYNQQNINMNNINSNIKYCPNCGSQNNQSANNCLNCGRQF